MMMMMMMTRVLVAASPNRDDSEPPLLPLLVWVETVPSVVLSTDMGGRDGWVIRLSMQVPLAFLADT